MTERQLKPGWKMVRFGDVVKLNTDRVADPLAQGIERYVGLEHLTPEDLHIHSWGLVAEGTTFTNYFKPGQVLFGKRRAYQRKVAVAEFEGVCSGDIYVFEPKDDQLLPELLPFICQSDAFFDHAVGTSAGSLSPRTNWEQLAKYEFALPPMEEQCGIANLLLAVDDLIQETKSLIYSLSRAKAATRTYYFCDYATNTFRLKDLCEVKGIQIGPFGSQLHASDYIDNGIPVVMPANMTDDRIDESSIASVSQSKADGLSQHKVLTGDILLPRRGELDRRAYILPEQEGWLCGTGSLRIRVKAGISSRAVFHALASPNAVGWLKNHAVGTTMPNINATIVSNIPIMLPPGQVVNQVVEALEDLDRAHVKANNKLEEEMNLKRRVLEYFLG